MPDGDYQSCTTCERFVTCSNGHFHDMPCAPNDPPLVWDGVKKTCEYESTTCPSTSPPSTAYPPSSSGTSPSTTSAYPGEPGICVSDCSDMPNGDYQSCTTCERFVTCSNGHFHDMPCAPNDPPLVWDDVKKRCEFESTTCPPTSPTSTGAPPHSTTSPSTTVRPPGTPGPCVSDCTDMPDGVYPSCKSDDVYVICDHGLICEKACVSDCRDMPDGLYQSCKFCDAYVECKYGLLCEIACKEGYFWDDREKKCVLESTTCPIPSTTIRPPTGGPTSPSPTSHGPPATDPCVSDCSGMPNGDYQSCETCERFVTCSNGHYYDMPCAPSDPPLVWDDVKKRCEYESTTCPSTSPPSTTSSPSSSSTSHPPPGPGPCVSDCSGMANGDYQSCYTCERFVSCSNGHYYDMPCAPNHPGQLPLVWDDVKKRCEWTSSTCSIP